MRAVAVVGALTAIMVALMQPGHAAAIGRLVLVVIVGACVAPVLHRLAERYEYADARAFVPDPLNLPPTIETPDVTELVRMVTESPATISATLAGRLRTVLAGRLLDRHRLHLDRPEHRAAIDHVIGDRLRHLVELDADHPAAIRTHDLTHVLDELDQLDQLDAT